MPKILVSVQEILNNTINSEGSISWALKESVNTAEIESKGAAAKLTP